MRINKKMIKFIEINEHEPNENSTQRIEVGKSVQIATKS